MRKILTALVAAATLAGAAVAMSGPGAGVAAAAGTAAVAWRWRGGGWGWGAGGFVAGALVGSALASSLRYGYGDGYLRLLSASLLRTSLRVAALVEWLRLGARLRLSSQGRTGSAESRGVPAGAPSRAAMRDALSAPNFRQIVELQWVWV